MTIHHGTLFVGPVEDERRRGDEEPRHALTTAGHAAAIEIFLHVDSRGKEFVRPGIGSGAAQKPKLK